VRGRLSRPDRHPARPHPSTRARERAAQPNAERLSMQVLAPNVREPGAVRAPPAAGAARSGPARPAPPRPLRAWAHARELPVVPEESFRDWWRRERG
jgi:hypothetical protein